MDPRISGAAWLTKVEGNVMRTKIATATILAIGMSALATSRAGAESASNDAEIALLKQQLRLLEQKLDKLEK
jgi:phosphate-selective porin OprO/OprP